MKRKPSIDIESTASPCGSPVPGTPRTPTDLTELAASWADHISIEGAALTRDLTAQLRRAVVFGLFCTHVKREGKRLGIILHGQFQPWLNTNCPAMPFRTIQRYMTLAEGVCESIGCDPESVVDGFALPEILQLTDAQLPEPARKLQSQIFELVDGKTQKQLLFQFRDPDARPGGDMTPRDENGNRIQAPWGAKRNEARAERAEMITQALVQDIRKCYTDHLPLLSDRLIAELHIQVQELNRRIREINDAKRNGRE